MDVVIYSTHLCSYCMRARQLLEAKGVGFTEILVDEDTARRVEMQRRSGRNSVPQIFIGERHVGGFTDLWQLEVSGELDVLLGRAPPRQVVVDDNPQA